MNLGKTHPKKFFYDEIFFFLNLIVIYIVVVVAFIVVFNMTVVENVFNNKFGYSTYFSVAYANFSMRK